MNLLIRIVPISCLLLLIAGCTSEGLREMSNNTPLLGSWQLVSWTTENPSGEVHYPYGKEAYGKLIYESNGNMTALLMSDDRALFTSEDIGSRKPEEALKAFNSFFAYAGPYTVVKDSSFVLHKVEACNNPNWVGRTQKRMFALSGDTLTLSTPPIAVLGNETRASKQVLVWSKSK